MRASISAGSLLLLSAGACSPSVHLAVPSDADTRSMVVVVARHGVGPQPPLDVEAYDQVADAAKIEIGPIDRQRGDVFKITALLYTASLEEQSIPSGKLPASSNSTAAETLPTAGRRAIETTVEGASVGPWVDATTLDPELESFRFQPPGQVSACPTFQFESLDTGARADFSFAILVSDGAVLIGTRDGRVLRTDFDGHLSPVRLPAGAPVFSGAYQEPEGGRLWLVATTTTPTSAIARLWRAPLGALETLALVPSSSVGAYAHWLAGPTEKQARMELFTLSLLGEVRYWNNAALASQVLYRFPDHGFDFLAYRSDLLWTTPQHAVAVKSTEPDLVDAFSDSIAHQPGSNNFNGFSALAVIPSLRMEIAGDNEGLLFHRPSGSSGAWTIFPEVQLGNAVVTIAPYRDGFLVLTDSGLVSAYFPGRGFCPTHGDYRTEALHHLFINGDRGLLIGGGDGRLITERVLIH